MSRKPTPQNGTRRYRMIRDGFLILAGMVLITVIALAAMDKEDLARDVLETFQSSDTTPGALQ